VEVRVQPKDGGSRLDVEWSRRDIGLRGNLIIGLVALSRGAPVRENIQRGLDRLAARQPA
jgi:hypothetical protein